MSITFGSQCSRTKKDEVYQVTHTRGKWCLNFANEGVSSVRELFLKTFLPIGYPNTVKPEYLEYQLYDSIQALCSYLRGILCTHALLVSAGVGSENASAVAAAITWVTRDGVGMISSIVFGTYFSVSFGVYVKEWRLFADVINDAAQILDIMTQFFPRQVHVYILSLSAIFKTMCGISAGATKLCVTNHLCLAQNAADVSAKEGSQETAVSLIGLLVGILVAKFIGTETIYAMVIFAVLTVVHVYANYRAVSCLRLETINRPRCAILVQEALAVMRKVNPEFEARVAAFKAADVYCAYAESNCNISVKRVNMQESLMFTMRLVMFNQYDIHLGCSLIEALKEWSRKNNLAVSKDELHVYTKAFSGCKYCILPRLSGGYSVLFEYGATPVRITSVFTLITELLVSCRWMSCRRMLNAYLVVCCIVVKTDAAVSAIIFCTTWNLSTCFGRYL